MPGFRRFWRDDKGASAVEFAMILPVMAGVLLVLIQFFNTHDANKKFQLAVFTAGDLASQAKTLTDADMIDLFGAAAAITFPLDPGPLQIVVTSLSYESATEGKVVWSDAKIAPSPYNPGDIVTLPPGIMIAGQTIILSEGGKLHEDEMGIIEGAAHASTVFFEDKYYFSPRRTTAVGRSPG